MTALVWLRRDLRLHDHPALRAALDAHDRVVPVFCFDDRLLHGRHASGARTQFLLESLADLDASLRARGGALVVRRGPPEQLLPALAERVGAREVFLTRDVSPFARERDGRVARALAGAGLRVRQSPGLTVVDRVEAVTTASGRPFTVFTPFWRAWQTAPRRTVLDAPEAVPLPRGLRGGALPTLRDLALDPEVPHPPAGGESAGRRRRETWLRSGVVRYDETRDALDANGTSRLSPYLHLGCVSPRELEARLSEGGSGPGAFRRQLSWRDFHHHVLLAFPANARREHQARFRGLRWERDEILLAAWQEGRTGFPLVDAGMRQLQREGWMPNRARLIVGSFLTKDLGLDWRCGERWFMRLLVDGDEANNNGNWQWIASVGVDPQPYYRRMYNPARQMQRFDPHGRYVREYVPELRAVPDCYLQEPWEMPLEAQRAAECIIGHDYPAPVVDRRIAREAAKARYAAAVE